MLTSKTSDAWLALPTPPTSTSLASHSLPITLLPPPFATATAAPATVMVSFDGLPDPEAFDAALTRRTSTFKRKSAGAALVTREKYEETLLFLRDPKSLVFADRYEGARLRQYYRIGYIYDGGERRAIVEGNRGSTDKVFKRVACREDLWSLVTQAHLAGKKHRDVDETFDVLRPAWTELPKWAVEEYCKLCPRCSPRRRYTRKNTATAQSRAPNPFSAPKSAQLACASTPSRGTKRTDDCGDELQDHFAPPSKKARAGSVTPNLVKVSARQVRPSHALAVGRVLSSSSACSTAFVLHSKRARDDDDDDEDDDDDDDEVDGSSLAKRPRARAGHRDATPTPQSTIPPAPLTPESLALNAASGSPDPITWPTFLERALTVDSSGVVTLDSGKLPDSSNASAPTVHASVAELEGLGSPIDLRAPSAYSTPSVDGAGPCSSAGRMSRTSSIDSNASFWSTSSASTATTINSSCSSRTTRRPLAGGPRSEVNSPPGATLGAAPFISRSRTLYASWRADRPNPFAAAFDSPQYAVARPEVHLVEPLSGATPFWMHSLHFSHAGPSAWDHPSTISPRLLL